MVFMNASKKAPLKSFNDFVQPAVEARQRGEKISFSIVVAGTIKLLTPSFPIFDKF